MTNNTKKQSELESIIDEFRKSTEEVWEAAEEKLAAVLLADLEAREKAAMDAVLIADIKEVLAAAKEDAQ